ncbi:MAG: hypothetical protein H6713_37915 [Myxococcales bacterium]|nr:hypothetical protein [Myxococcales bacterium]
MLHGRGLMWLWAAPVCVTLACGDAGGETSEASASDGGASETSAAASTSAGGTDGATSEASGAMTTAATSGATTGGATTAETTPLTTGPKFDQAVPDGAPPVSEGCSKVDFLFVVDDSGSMGDEQVSLNNSFSGFIDAIQMTLEEVDSYHVGVVTSDAYSANAPGCQEIGALVTQTQNGACGPFADGFRFMTEADDLNTTFACAGQPGTIGAGDNTSMQAVYTAVSPELNAPGACNEGFLRDDALLVIVVITDEEDDHDNPPGFDYYGSPGDPLDWYDAVVAAKGGVEENIAVLSLVQHEEPNDCPPQNNIEPLITWFLAVRIMEFTQMFTHGTIGDICVDNYASFFSDAVSIVGEACETFTPPT